jgi:hypothetical protein
MGKSFSRRYRAGKGGTRPQFRHAPADARIQLPQKQSSHERHFRINCRNDALFRRAEPSSYRKVNDSSEGINEREPKMYKAIATTAAALLLSTTFAAAQVSKSPQEKTNPGGIQSDTDKPANATSGSSNQMPQPMDPAANQTSGQSTPLNPNAPKQPQGVPPSKGGQQN